MTLCVAVQSPCKALNPVRRPLELPEVVILYADTRFSRMRGKKHEVYSDAGIKVWPVGDSGVAGFSGDVELGEVSLFSLGLTVGEHGFRDADKIALAAKVWLIHYHSVLNYDRTTAPTEVLLGMFDADRDRFFLYRLSSDKGFEPTRRSGVCAVGTGADEFCSAFRTEVVHMTFGWAAPARSGYKMLKTDDGKPFIDRFGPNDRIPIRSIDVAGLVQATADLVVKKSGIATVGGSLQGYCLDRTGLQWFEGKRRSQDGTWQSITATDRLSYSEMAQKKYEIPHMNADCVIEAI